MRAAGLGQARGLTFRAARASTIAHLSSRTSQATYYLSTTLEELPERGDKARRKMWQRITKQHASTMKEVTESALAADAAQARSPSRLTHSMLPSVRAPDTPPQRPAPQLPAPQTPARRSPARPRSKPVSTPEPEHPRLSCWQIFQQGGPEAEKQRRYFRGFMTFCHDEPGAGGTQWKGCNAWHNPSVPCSEIHRFPAHRGKLKMLQKMAGKIYVDGHGEQHGSMDVTDFLADPWCPKAFSWPID